MQEGSVLSLDKSLLIGRGGSKDVYIDPRNPGRCIKISVRDPNPRDIRQETAYRKVRKIRRLPPSTLMVEYYGTVETDLGLGYVFERVADFDGETSMTIEGLIEKELEARKRHVSVSELLRTEKEYPCVMECLLVFRDILFKENIIIPDMGAFNYVVQFDSPKEWRIRIVDDLGSPTLIPIVYYIDYFGAKHVRRRWKRFIREIMDLYPACLSQEESDRLMEF